MLRENKHIRHRPTQMYKVQTAQIAYARHVAMWSLYSCVVLPCIASSSSSPGYITWPRCCGRVSRGCHGAVKSSGAGRFHALKPVDIESAF